MKCYTVYTDRVEPGILPQEDDGKDRTGILFGKAGIMRMDDDWARRLKDLAIAEAKLDKKDNPEEDYELRRFANADFTDDGLLLLPRPINEEAVQALVLIRPESEIEGAYDITAATWEEEWDPRREAVVRKYLPLQAAVGIEIVVEHVTAALVVMERGASFRVQAMGADRKIRHYIYQWRDWKWPKLERVVPPTKKEAA